MMTNLFSIFDLWNIFFNIPFNCLSTLLGFMFIPYSFWLIPNRHFMLWNNISFKLHNEFKMLLGINSFKGTTFIFIFLLFFFFLMIS